MVFFALCLHNRDNDGLDKTIDEFRTSIWQYNCPPEANRFAEKIKAMSLLQKPDFVEHLSGQVTELLQRVANDPTTCLRGQLRQNFKAAYKAARTKKPRNDNHQRNLTQIPIGLENSLLGLRVKCCFDPTTQPLATTILVQQPWMLPVTTPSGELEGVKFSTLDCLPFLDDTNPEPEWLPFFLRCLAFHLSKGFSDHPAVFLWLLPHLSKKMFDRLEPTLRTVGRHFFKDAFSVPACLAPYARLFLDCSPEEEARGVSRAVLMTAKKIQEDERKWLDEVKPIVCVETKENKLRYSMQCKVPASALKTFNERAEALPQDHTLPPSLLPKRHMRRSYQGLIRLRRGLWKM
jgi:hypothetical protein